MKAKRNRKWTPCPHGVKSNTCRACKTEWARRRRAAWTPEKRAAVNERVSALRKSWTPEKRAAESERQRARYLALTPEQRNIYAARFKEYTSTIPPERRRKDRRDSWRKMITSLTPIQRKERSSKFYRLGRERLTDSYVRQIIIRNFPLKITAAQVPVALIESKRAQLKVKHHLEGAKK